MMEKSNTFNCFQAQVHNNQQNKCHNVIYLTQEISMIFDDNRKDSKITFSRYILINICMYCLFSSLPLVIPLVRLYFKEHKVPSNFNHHYLFSLVDSLLIKKWFLHMWRGSTFIFKSYFMPCLPSRFYWMDRIKNRLT